jgi:hypothetical protein
MDRQIAEIKARRIIRRMPKEFWAEFTGPLFNRGQLITLSLAVMATFIVLRSGDDKAMANEVAGWQVAIEAFSYVALAWAVLSLILAPFRIVKKDREKGGWNGNDYIYFKPDLVDVSVWTPNEADKGKTIVFRDVEPGSLVAYKVELYPPVQIRASIFMERYCGELDNILGSIITPGGAARLPGHGLIGIVGNKAVLRVKLDPKTVEVTARTYVTQFTVNRKRDMS